MKKLIMLLTVVAFTASYSFAQNTNSGVTVTKNAAGGWLFVDCDGNGGIPTVSLTQSTLVTKADGSAKLNATYDASDWCPPAEATKYDYGAANVFGVDYDSVIGIHTPGGNWIIKAKKAKD